MQTITLPWPPAILSPNKKAHWGQKHTAAQNYKQACFVLAKKAALKATNGRIAMHIEFVPPNRQRRDDDNAIASFKHGRDGLALALGVDDSLFDPQYKFNRDIIGGYVKVTF